MKPLVFIDGDQGTTGLRIHQLLAGRNDLKLLRLRLESRKSTAHRAEALNACDLALLCLPDAAAREAVALVRRPGVRIIDASSAHRTAQGWVYGLPELEPAQPGRIAAAGRVSNPGCYPTGAVALLRPLENAGADRIDPQALNGSNRLRLAVYTRPDSGQVLLIAVLDNLGKGAAGAAVQNMELMPGLATRQPEH